MLFSTSVAVPGFVWSTASVNGGQPMIKMQIVLDEEKILSEKKYSIAKIRAFLDNVFLEKCNLSKDKEGFYVVA
jgi:hypothetical protein